MSSVGISTRPRLLRWFWATRPRIFTATLVPFALVAVLALGDGVFHLPRFLAALLTALLLQAAANLINEPGVALPSRVSRALISTSAPAQGMTLKKARTRSPFSRKRRCGEAERLRYIIQHRIGQSAPGRPHPRFKV